MAKLDVEQARKDLEVLSSPMLDGRMNLTYGDGYYAKSLERKYGMSIEEIEKAIKQDEAPPARRTRKAKPKMAKAKKEMAVADNSVDEKAVMKEARALAKVATLLTEDPKNMDDQTALISWSVLDAFEKELIKNRQSQLRDSLFERAVKHGEKNKNGSYIYDVPGTDGKITKQYTSAKKIRNADILKSLLEEKGISTRGIIVRTVTYSVDDAGLQALLEDAKLSKEEIASFTTEKPEQWALKVKKPPKIVQMFSKVKETIVALNPKKKK